MRAEIINNPSMLQNTADASKYLWQIGGFVVVSCYF